MNYENLSDFLTNCEDDGDLIRIAVEVDPALELAEITDRVCKSADGSPVLFFENVQGSALPVVVNLLGSERRICKALRTSTLDELAGRIAGLLQPELPEDWLASLKLVPQFAQLTRLPPKQVKTALCQQVVKMGRDVDLTELPIPRCWPGDAAAVITAGQVFTRHPTTAIRNVGFYPLQVRSPNSLLVHWYPQDVGRLHFREHQHEHRQMPVAVALGGDPVSVWTAHAPLPPHTDECLLAGYLRGQGVELVKCRSIELDVAADAEIVIEGLIDPTAPLETAGPVGRSTGCYSISEDRPVLNVTAVTHRANPVFPAIIPGVPPTEEDWLHKATERLLLPLVRLSLPEVTNIHWPRAGAYRNLLFVSIRKEYPQQARKVMHALWGLSPLMAAKMIVVVDDGVEVQDEERVWFHVGANAHPGRDVVFCEGPTHWDDHAAPVRGLGHKMGIDATRKLPDEGHPRPWPEPLTSTPEIRDRVTRRWAEYGFGNNL